ncbi:MAG: TolC family protein [Casimicrobiaceae bacterium]
MQSSFRFLAVALFVAGSAAPLTAQQLSQTLSLADAIRLAQRESEAVRIARAGIDRAQGQYLQARSQKLPQVTGTASYQRTLQSQFSEIAERTATSDSGGDAGAGFADSPLARVFASKNTMVLGLNASQVLYAGGSVNAGIAAANAGRRAADLAEINARAQLAYETSVAYLDVQVAERLVAIADSSFAQTERALRQTTLAREVGNTAEYDLIRARVQRDNARPGLIAATTRRDVALHRLRQLLNISGTMPLVLTTSIDAATAFTPTDVRSAGDLGIGEPDTTTAARAIVRAAQEGIRSQEELLRATRGQRLPQISLTTNYQRFAYPSGILEDRVKMYFPNWTASLGLSLPIYTGGRRGGDELVARANLAEAQQRYEQVREAASLDTRLAVADLQQAEAILAASSGTDEQAARGYAIAEVRFNEGLATQVELSQARVDLGVARANRVQAARDVALARLKLALLRDLPLGVSTTQR